MLAARTTRSVARLSQSLALPSRALSTGGAHSKFMQKWDLYDQHAAQLDGSVQSHVSAAQANKAEPAQCPFLKSDPVLVRTAQRESNARSYNRRFPISIAKADGCYIWDTEGRKFLDSLACAGTLAMGHNHPLVVDAAVNFMQSGQPLQTLDLTSPVKDDFVSEVFASLPSSFAESARIQFCGPSGADAVEAAIKLCKLSTGRGNIMAFAGGYHGHSTGTLALMGNLGPKTDVQNLMPGAHFAPYPYVYRCPFGQGGEMTSELCSKYLDNLLHDVESGVSKPAAVILEAVQGEGGVVPAPASFLQELRRITLEHDIPLILDEIQAGWARTGKPDGEHSGNGMFAFEHANIEPDVITLSKAIGGGMPMACIVYNKKLDSWGPGSHAGTFRGNQLAMATGSAVIKYLRENDMASQVTDKGVKLRGRLEKLQQEFPHIGDVRGRGLMIGAEMVDPSVQGSQGSPAPGDGDLAGAIQAHCFRRGLIIERGGRHGAVVRFLPPLIINDEEMDELCDKFEESVRAAIAERA